MGYSIHFEAIFSFARKEIKNLPGIQIHANHFGISRGDALGVDCLNHSMSSLLNFPYLLLVYFILSNPVDT